MSVLQSLHDELDAAVLDAYGWSDLGARAVGATKPARAAWTETLLERLVALNAKRAAEETAGTVRWLRPEFQDPARRVAAASAQAALSTAPPSRRSPSGRRANRPRRRGDAAEASRKPAPTTGEARQRRAGARRSPGHAATAQPWPPGLPEQVRAVAQLLAASPAPLPLPAIEAAFKGKGPWKKGLPRILETLEALGRATRGDGGWRG